MTSRPSRKSHNKRSVQRLRTQRRWDWFSTTAVVALIGFIAVLAINLIPKYQARSEIERFLPSEENPDPSTQIDGVTRNDYPPGDHVDATQRVAYDQSPPFGGPHDGLWATCTGTVYSVPIRTENAVHSLEHGAVWLTYNPDHVTAEQVSTLSSLVDGQPYTLMSPYPGQDQPVSVQSWGRQLKLDDPNDPRLRQFISALRLNSNTYPEPGASCSTERFDPANPPLFDPRPPGPDAVPVSGTTAPADPSGG